MAFPNELLAQLLRALKKEPSGDVYFGSIAYTHNKVHEGKMLAANHVFTNVANGATVYFRQAVGPTKYLHSILEISSTGLWNFKSYVGTTYTADGTAVAQVNRKSDSTYVPDGLVYHTPTIDTLGTLRLNFDFGSGTNPAQATTAVGTDRLESVFAPNTDVLVALTNNSGATQRLSIFANYYEEE